ncbi:hypothetical protein [Armatimonas rosea]|uniref:Cation transport ATPase n=1 Tax=Armatimonas rosea TaxID=685828 RepID=A0A7W9SN89_ARMRO|nr:hypothetical protein [Armatimonas rosea]MBB6049103.1 cation transport ATPase [Armatimonas rosea]
MQQQQHREPQQSRPRWRLHAGEWVILLLNALLAGFAGWLSRAITLSPDLPLEPRQRLGNSLAIGSLWLIALGAGLTCLLLLLRQKRLAAWFQWFVAAGFAVVAGAYVFFASRHQPLLYLLPSLGALLLLTTLFALSGRFLQKRRDDN